MAKRSKKHNVHHERGHSGCMWGLINIFDFRQGRSTRKLLSDKRHGSGRHGAGAGALRGKIKLSELEESNLGNNDHDDAKALEADIAKTSVKKLMEEDMSKEQQTKNQISNVASESDSKQGGDFEKNHRQRKRTCKVVHDIDPQDSKASESFESCGPLEQFSHLDLAALMEEFCNQIHHRREIRLQCENVGDSSDVYEPIDHVKHNQFDELDVQLVQKHCILQEKLSEAAEAFLNQKFIDRHQSKLFVDALDILNSNKELLMRLLQDSNPMLLSHMQDSQDPQLEKGDQSKLLAEEEFQVRKQVPKHNAHNIFKFGRIKSENKNSLKAEDNKQASNRVVLLKPYQTGRQSSVDTNSPSSSFESHFSLKNQKPIGRFSSQFSLNEIKRKLKHAIGENRKERHWIFMDGILHRIPSKRHDCGNGRNEISERELTTETQYNIEGTAKPYVSSDSGDTIDNPTDCHPSTNLEVASTSALKSTDLTMNTDGYPNHQVSNIYTEAKKHLAEMLSNGDVDGNFSNLQNPRTLGRIMSLPEYDFSPVFSPRKDRQQGFITAQMRFSPYGKYRIVNENMWWPKPDGNPYHLSPLRQNKEIQQKITDNDKPEVILQELESNANTAEELLLDTEIPKSASSSEGDVSPKGKEEIAEVRDTVSSIEDNCMNESSQSDMGTSVISTMATTMWEDEESFTSLEQDAPKKCQPLPSSSLFIQKGEPLESINDAPERPSPVSVLEPMFIDDFNSPTCNIFQSAAAEIPVQPQQIHFEEDDCSTLMVTPINPENYSRNCTENKNSILEYVTGVLQASNLNFKELTEKLYSSEQLLEPSLFNEVEGLSSQLCDDRKLLFDSTNEVLVEVCERYYGCSPWVGFVNPNVRPAPVGKGIINEVWEGINWHLIPELIPRTLDQIVGKDMERARMWTDFRHDAEGIGSETAELILEDLIEDAILDFWS